MSSLQSAVERANAAWLANYTFGDERWRLKQLYGLYQMVIDNRESIISSLTKESGQCALPYEREIALLIADLQAHISNLTGNKASSPLVHSASYGLATVEELPLGVSLIISNSQNFIRYALAPLAASIAANNVVVLATSMDLDHAFNALLTQEWSKYFSPETVFWVPEVDITDIEDCEIDHVMIFDNSPAAYSTILQRPEAHFYSIALGYNIAIIDEGRKDWENIAAQISHTSSDGLLPSDRLSSVFVRSEDVSELHNALTLRWKTEEIPTDRQKLHFPDFTQWGTRMFSLDTSSGRKPGGKVMPSLESKLRQIQDVGALLVVTVNSLEKALDMLSSLSRPIQQLALLAPGSKRTLEYASRWSNASVFSVGTIRTALPPCSHNSSSSKPPGLMFSPTSFSRVQVVAKESPVNYSTDVSTIRASYEKLIPPLKPEPRGERVGFFTQAEYLLKGAAATTAILTGTCLYFGVKAYRQR